MAKHTDNWLRRMLAHAQSIGDVEEAAALGEAIWRREEQHRSQQNQENAKLRTGTGRVPANIAEELDELMLSKRRADAVKVLAERYSVAPGTINTKIRRARNKTT